MPARDGAVGDYGSFHAGYRQLTSAQVIKSTLWSLDVWLSGAASALMAQTA